MIEWSNNQGFVITTDKTKIDMNRLHEFLSQEAYWSKNIPYEIVKISVDNSVCFSILSPQGVFIGFARVITDKATFGYLADVFVVDEYKGKGLGKWLIEIIMQFNDFKTLRNWFLYTKDAHKFYAKFGWKSLDEPDRAMAIRTPSADIYKKYN